MWQGAGVSTSEADDRTRLTAFVRGRVQGVGFRWFVRSQALELGLTGYAKNLPDGRVEVLAQGPAQACGELLNRLEEQPTRHRRPGHVNGVVHHYLPPVADTGGFIES